MFKLKTLATYVAVALAGGTLVACSDGGSGDKGTASQVQMSGAVVDGYVAGGTVFLDTNGNGVWDKDIEYTTAKTDSSGYFSVNKDGKSYCDAAADTYNETYCLRLYDETADVIIQGGIDLTTGLPFRGKLIMKYETGNSREGKVVSPMTTLVSNMNEADWKTLIAKIFAANNINLDDLSKLNPLTGTSLDSSITAGFNLSGEERRDLLKFNYTVQKSLETISSALRQNDIGGKEQKLDSDGKKLFWKLKTSAPAGTTIAAQLDSDGRPTTRDYIEESISGDTNFPVYKFTSTNRSDKDYAKFAVDALAAQMNEEVQTAGDLNAALEVLTTPAKVQQVLTKAVQVVADKQSTYFGTGTGVTKTAEIKLTDDAKKAVSQTVSQVASKVKSTLDAIDATKFTGFNTVDADTIKELKKVEIVTAVAVSEPTKPAKVAVATEVVKSTSFNPDEANLNTVTSSITNKTDTEVATLVTINNDGTTKIVDQTALNAQVTATTANTKVRNFPDILVGDDNQTKLTLLSMTNDDTKTPVKDETILVLAYFEKLVTDAKTGDRKANFYGCKAERATLTSDYKKDNVTNFNGIWSPSAASPKDTVIIDAMGMLVTVSSVVPLDSSGNPIATPADYQWRIYLDVPGQGADYYDRSDQTPFEEALSTATMPKTQDECVSQLQTKFSKTFK